MHIECPSCQEESKIDYAENIRCSKCNKTFKGYTYRKFKVAKKTAISALIIGAFAGVTLDNSFESERYPVEIEFAILDSCINSSQNQVSLSWYETKKDVCQCALTKVQSVMPYSEYKADNRRFLQLFSAKSKSC